MAQQKKREGRQPQENWQGCTLHRGDSYPPNQFPDTAADDPNNYASHPNPAASYDEAVQMVEMMRAAEVGFNPDCHTVLLTHGTKTAKVLIFAPGYGTCPAAPYKEFGKLFYDRGYNVLIAPLPYNGLEDRMTIQQAKLQAEDLVRYTDQVVDIGHRLGDHLTLAGISAGGLVTGWAVQQRQDVDRAVLISPGLGFDVIPESLTPLASRPIKISEFIYLG